MRWTATWRPTQAGRHAVAVEAQPDQVAIEPHDAAELAGLVPVERHGVLEPLALEELLALEEHRDARAR
jgi:hypothetical protein